MSARGQSVGRLAAVLVIVATVLAPTALAQHSTANLTRQIKRCDKKFGGHTRRQRKARQRCIKKAKNAARRKGSIGQGADESTPGPPPLQSQGSSSLALATTTLHEGVAGLPYVDQLSATGGTAPYTYAVSGLPAGLSGDSSGFISGSPTAIGTSNVGVEVTDAAGAHVQGAVTLAVPTTMPADCTQQSCSHLTADGETVQIDGSKVTAVTRDPQTKEVTGLSLTGPAPAPQQIIVVSPTEALPSGLTALVLTATPSGSEETSLTLNQATIGDAYASGTVQAIGSTPPAEGSHLAAATSRHSAASTGIHPAPPRPALAAASLNCGSGVSSDLRGLNVKPSLTPSMAAIWHHPLFGGGGFYPGTGGLELFQFDLNGDIQLNMGVSISGKATCTLQLPSLVEAIPAGDLGAVIIETTPTLTLKADGKIDTRASITLSCGVEYRWDKGNEYRGSYCAHSYEPLHLAADTGVNVTASGALETAVSLDDVVGVDGSITAALHAGYTPTLQPVAELDASLEYELGACLVCFWKGSPTRVTIAHGVLYHKIIATYDSTPPPPTDNSIQVEGLDFGALPAGQESVEHLTASGGAEPYKFAVSPDPSNLAKVPGWVNLESDGTVRIDPPPGTEQSVSFYVYTTDATGEHSPYERDLLTFSGSGSGTGMAWSAIKAPVPPNGDPEYNSNVFHAPACSPDGTCVLPEEYKDRDGKTHEMIQTLSAGSWSAIDSPVPTGGTSEFDSWFYTTPVCASGGTCMLFGPAYRDGGQEWHDLIDRLSGGIWSATELPVPDGGKGGSGQYVNLFSQVCAAAVDVCVFPGSYRRKYVTPEGEEYEGEGTMVASLYEGTWTAVQVPVPSGGETDSGISLAGWETGACSFDGTCVLPGEYGKATREYFREFSMLETYHNGSWSATELPIPPDGRADSGEFFEEEATGGPVSTEHLWCGPPGTCVVPARFTDNEGKERYMIDTLAGGSWSAADAPVPADGKPGSGGFFGGSPGTCSVDICVLPGYYETTTGERLNMFDTLVDGKWSAARAPGQGAGGQYNFFGVGGSGCSSDGTCVVLPTAGSIVDTYSEGTWTATQVPVPAGGKAGSAEIGDYGSSACSSNGICVVDGKYANSAGEERDMLDTFAGGTWRSIGVPVPPDGQGGSGFTPFSLMRCSSAVEICVVPGFYKNANGESRRMLVMGEGKQ